MNTATLTALAEPNRMRIVELLRDGPRPVGEIARKLVIRQPQVSKHLRVLSEAGIVRVRPQAQQRLYQLRPEPFAELDSWLDTFRKLWEDRLDILDNYLQEMKSVERKSPNTKVPKGTKDL
jgi:DNA-binding transcriptional ArsR family regulator